MKSHPSLSRNNPTTLHNWLLNNDLGLRLLHNNLGLGLNVSGLLLNNNNWSLLGANVVNSIVVEDGFDHEVTGVTTLELELNTVLARSSSAE